MGTDKPRSSGPDLEEAELVRRYDASQKTAGQKREPKIDIPWDPALEDQVESDWFAMGDQESWVEARPRAPRSWETPSKP